jgi:hypothetical protein
MRSSISLLIILIIISLQLSSAKAQGGQTEWTVEPTITGQGAGQSAAYLDPEAAPTFQSFNISLQEPRCVMLRGKNIPFPEFESGIRSNELWIDVGGNWSQYGTSTLGEELQIVAYAPDGGTADLYAISYTNSRIKHSQRELLPGYYSISLPIAEAGRVMLLFMTGSQPSNALILDASSPPEAKAGSIDIEKFSPGYARINVTSDWLTAYDIYVDGVFRRNDGGDGTVDGKASLLIGGDSIHSVIIQRKEGPGWSQYRSEHTKVFKSGYTYTLKI